MTQEEIIKGNKLIAEFMGYEFDGTYCKGKIGSLVGNHIHQALYHSSWDWLMPVVEKIESLDPNSRVTHTYSIEITGNGTTAYKSMYSGNESNIIFRYNVTNHRLFCTWKVVIEFIKWYNQNKKL